MPYLSSCVRGKSVCQPGKRRQRSSQSLPNQNDQVHLLRGHGLTFNKRPFPVSRGVEIRRLVSEWPRKYLNMKCEAAGTGRLVPPCCVYSVASNTFRASMNTIMGAGIRLNRYTVGSALQVQEEVSDATVPESDESSSAEPSDRSKCSSPNSGGLACGTCCWGDPEPLLRSTFTHHARTCYHCQREFPWITLQSCNPVFIL